MRTVQEVFNAAIDAGDYWGIGGVGCSYMCNALGRSAGSGVINEAEERAAAYAIKDYLQGSHTLAHFIVYNYPDYTDQDGDYTQLYRDWANRPGYTNGVANADSN